MKDLIVILSSILAVEAVTEVAIKGEIFFRVRAFIIERNEFLSQLVTCGYCFSFWISFLVCVVLEMCDELPQIHFNFFLNFIVIWIVLQRGSNMLHGAIDKYFDTRKDIRYNQGDIR